MFDKKKHSTLKQSTILLQKRKKRTIFDQNIWKSRSNDKHCFFSLSQKLSKQKFYAPSISSHDTIGWVKICFFKLLERKEQGWKGLSPTLSYTLRKAMLGRRDHITALSGQNLVGLAGRLLHGKASIHKKLTSWKSNLALTESWQLN